MASTTHKVRSRKRSGGSSSRQGFGQRFAAATTGARGRLIALFGFLLLAALTGGGSRADIQSLPLLRPAAVLFLVYALIVTSREKLRGVRVPMLWVLALMALALLQLVPLPYDIWTALPNREAIAEFGRIVGQPDAARPLSLDPNRTWNTFFALFVPLAAIALVAAQEPAQRKHILPALIGIGLLSAIFGVVQTMGTDALHLYRITNDRHPVGLFANRNHQSILLLWLMLAISFHWSAPAAKRRSVGALVGVPLGAIVLLFPLLVLTGSRAGLLLSIPTLLVCLWLLLRRISDDTGNRGWKKKGTGQKEIARRSTLILIGGMALVLLVVAAMLVGLAGDDRQTALARLFETSDIEEVRWNYFPIFWQMAKDFLPFGSGFGTFEAAFRMYEPVEILRLRYLNQAHNDPMQLLIEGGLAAVLLALAGVAWVVLACWRQWRSSSDRTRDFALFFLAGIGVWLLASFVDYPLRTPLAATVLACLTAMLSLVNTSDISALGLSRTNRSGGVRT